MDGSVRIDAAPDRGAALIPAVRCNSARFIVLILTYFQIVKNCKSPLNITTDGV